jgi:hypothetical protein
MTFDGMRKPKDASTPTSYDKGWRAGCQSKTLSPCSLAYCRTGTLKSQNESLLLTSIRHEKWKKKKPQWSIDVSTWLSNIVLSFLRNKKVLIHANFPDLFGILPIWSCQKGKSRYPDQDWKNTPKSRFSKCIFRLTTTNPEFRTKIYNSAPLIHSSQ